MAQSSLSGGSGWRLRCPSSAETVQRWHWSQEAGEEREREQLKERGCVKFLFLGSPCKHETSSR